jgi:hypothetical protein
MFLKSSKLRVLPVSFDKNLEKDHSHAFEMTRMVIPSGTRGIFPELFHALEACVKLMNHFVVSALVNSVQTRTVIPQNLFS